MSARLFNGQLAHVKNGHKNVVLSKSSKPAKLEVQKQMGDLLNRYESSKVNFPEILIVHMKTVQ